MNIIATQFKSLELFLLIILPISIFPKIQTGESEYKKWSRNHNAYLQG
jgi:hypothetical protein